MTQPRNGTPYGKNYDGSAGDVLSRLKTILDGTPRGTLAVAPLRRALLEATVQELERLYREVQERSL
jgi:hypothetical protein